MKIYLKFYWNSPYIGAFYSQYYRRLYLQLIPFIPIVFDFGPDRRYWTHQSNYESIVLLDVDELDLF